MRGFRRDVCCPHCEQPTLEQVRACVFAHPVAGSEVGATIVEHARGSTLSLRDADLIHRRPVVDEPAVMITFRCTACAHHGSPATVTLIITEEHGFSYMYWSEA